MLGMITWEEFWNVVNFNKDSGSDWFIEGPTRRFIETYKARPGFFTPYEDGQKFVGGLLATVVYPTALSILTGVSIICAVLGVVAGVGCLLVSTGAALLGSYELCDESIENSGSTFHIAGLALTAIVVSSFLTAVSLFHAPLSFLTRSGASLASIVFGCVAGEQPKQEANVDQSVHEITYLISI